MVKLTIARSANSSVVQSQPLVAVFSGGTNGIGLTTLKALAASHSTTGKGLRVYIIGRNQKATEKIIADCLSLCPQGDFRFVRTSDLALLKEVDRVCEEITKAERACAANGDKPRVDMLFMSQGELSLEPYTRNAEGLEFRVSLLYYSRMKIILNLLPLLLESNLPAHVVSVFAAGKEGELPLDDLSMRDPKHRGLVSTRSTVTYMTTFFFEWLASQHAGKLSLVHVFPGLILTDSVRSMPLWARTLWWILRPALSLFCTSVEECGERILFLANPARFPAGSTQGETGVSTPGSNSTPVQGLAPAMGTDLKRGSGAYGVNLDGETMSESQIHKSYDRHRANDVGGKVVAHTVKAFEEIKAGRAFKD
ncbi:uncharacterized protein A1O9_11144 [Exophiala aquamarina CBS 119918]|uniref:Ketoreductase (KR) domain-containing protein n=1 Tax=Exophiala aquamarina CBS 119918 TaxID=1182545 RepID=A0A072NZ89_9EURO|nr:uncharacterized protein A1O9_11144 [Exophiala aquamarina CBS 119918]KEF52727.1 hypothetical protein A1O9_11144 [Exophiala aquamarina CBS 119918]